jgi:hypothetical protein
MFAGFPNPDLDPDPDPSINKQKNQEKPRLIFNIFVTSFYFLPSKTDVNAPCKSNKQKNVEVFFIGILSAVCQLYGSVDAYLDPYQNVTRPQEGGGGKGNVTVQVSPRSFLAGEIGRELICEYVGKGMSPIYSHSFRSY